jgi:hypothetical protein
LIARRQTSPIKLKSMLCRTKATIATKIRRFPPCMLLPLAESPLSLHSCRSTPCGGDTAAISRTGAQRTSRKESSS